MFLTRIIKVLVIVVVAFAFASVATAFAATNTVQNGYAGEGSGTVSGYNVTAVQYHLNATTPSSIDNVTFTLDHAATIVRIKLVAAGSTYYSCTNSGFNWTCTTTGATVSPTDQLTVIATE